HPCAILSGCECDALTDDSSAVAASGSDTPAGSAPSSDAHPTTNAATRAIAAALVAGRLVVVILMGTPAIAWHSIGTRPPLHLSGIAVRRVPCVGHANRRPPGPFASGAKPPGRLVVVILVRTPAIAWHSVGARPPLRLSGIAVRRVPCVEHANARTPGQFASCANPPGRVVLTGQPVRCRPSIRWRSISVMPP